MNRSEDTVEYDGVDLHAEKDSAFNRFLASSSVTLLIFSGLCAFVIWFILVPIEYETTWQFSELESYPSPAVLGFGCTFFVDDIYLAGGHTNATSVFTEQSFSNRTLQYDISNSTWNEMSPLPFPMRDFSLKSYGLHLWAFGGLVYDASKNPPYRALNSVLRFDPAQNIWESVSTMPRARWSHGVGIIKDKAFILGGWDENSTWHSAIDVCDLVTLQCTQTHWNIPRLQRAFTTVEWNDAILLLGGIGTLGEYLTRVTYFNPTTGEFSNSIIPPIPYGQDLPAIAVQGQNLILFGGNYTRSSDKPEFQTAVYMYEAGFWEEMESSLKHPRGYAVAVPFSDIEIGVFGGINETGILSVSEQFALIQIPKHPL